MRITKEAGNHILHRKVIKGAVRLFFIGGEGDRWAAIEVD